MKTRTLCAVLLIVGQYLLAQLSSAQVIALTGANLVDVESGDIQTDSRVLIDGERITAVGPRNEVVVPSGAKEIDLSGRWLIPGLMNMHVHRA